MLTSDPAFLPPHCPNPECSHHASPAGWRWERNGHYRRRALPPRIQRYRCLDCGRQFSSQTFDTTYYLKRPELQRPLHEALISCTGLRQVARSQSAAPSTMQRQASRLGRHNVLFQWLHRPPRPEEPVVLDGLMTFEFSQYHPCEVNFLVGSASHFVHGYTHSALRRSGRMTEAQRLKRESNEKRWGKPHPRATENAVKDLLSMTLPPGCEVELWSDKHESYPRAFRRLPLRIRHLTVSSRRTRTTGNPLFPVNLLDTLVRHSSANHKRETIAFAKRVQGALERLAVFVTWRNFIKRTSERRKDSRTPAQEVGLMQWPLRPDDVYRRRLFPSLVQLPKPMEDVYWRRVPTRQIPNGTRHELKYAA